MKKFFKVFNTILAYVAGFAVALISLDYLYFIFIYEKPVNCLECLEEGDFIGLTSGSLPILIIAIAYLIIYFRKLRKIAS